MTGHLDPVRWPAADLKRIILIAVGARYGHHIVTADRTLAPYGSAVPHRTNDATGRLRIVRSSPTPTLEALSGKNQRRPGSGSLAPHGLDLKPI